MIFVDEAKIFVQAGKGGNGCESFYKDNYIRYPRPDGGDGGKGGDVILVADRHAHTLLDFRYNQHYKAEKGGHASSKNKTGKTGKSCVLKVPQGTLIKDFDTGLLIKDLVDDQQSVTVALGGRGGLGNGAHKFPQPPKDGQERTIHLELKVIADVGLIGFPNAGKSTFISSVSRVKSKVANYPFTTKQPILGIVRLDGGFDFVLADLPGIIEGAHTGKGLGDKFLKHAERTKILVHMLDMGGTEARDPLDDYEKMIHEINAYGNVLAQKQRIVVANKMDVPQAQENLKRFKEKYKEEIIPISTIERKGITEVLNKIRESLCKENSPEK